MLEYLSGKVLRDLSGKGCPVRIFHRTGIVNVLGKTQAEDDQRTKFKLLVIVVKVSWTQRVNSRRNVGMSIAVFGKSGDAPDQVDSWSAKQKTEQDSGVKSEQVIEKWTCGN